VAAKILVVEDDPATQFLLKIWLEPLGEIFICNHGREAWDILAGGAMFDLIVTDHEMPWLTGKALVEKIRSEKTYDKIPIIMVTASIDPLEVDALKIHGFFEKPIRPDALIAAAQDAMRSSRI
jgi:CheY-like chemotaxis protein